MLPGPTEYMRTSRILSAYHSHMKYKAIYRDTCNEYSSLIFMAIALSVSLLMLLALSICFYLPVKYPTLA